MSTMPHIHGQFPVFVTVLPNPWLLIFYPALQTSLTFSGRPCFQVISVQGASVGGRHPERLLPVPKTVSFPTISRISI